MPDGEPKRASAPGPSTLPDSPGAPASVVTAPVAMTTFMIVLPSATKRLPAPSTAMSYRMSSKWMDTPVRSASVVTVPVAIETLRMMLVMTPYSFLLVSATYRLAAPSLAMPAGPSMSDGRARVVRDRGDGAGRDDDLPDAVGVGDVEVARAVAGDGFQIVEAAAAPVPSWEPASCGLPASVVTVPVAMATFRMT